MKKVISIMITALMSAASSAQVNPKINQLFEELKQTKGALTPTAPSIMKRGGLDANGNRPSLDYSLPIYYRPDLIRGRQESLLVDSILQVDKACFDKRVKAIRRTISEMQKEAQDSLHYESHTNGKDTIVCSLNFCATPHESTNTATTSSLTFTPTSSLTSSSNQASRKVPSKAVSAIPSPCLASTYLPTHIHGET